MRILLKFIAYLFVALAVSSPRAGAFEDFFRGVEMDLADNVTSLLVRGFDPNAADERGQVALYLALKHESPKVFGVLMAHPAIKIDTPNAVGETPLMMAALRGTVPAIEQLIARGASVNRDGWTPLHYAASGPSGEAVKALLARGAKVDAVAPNGSTALMMAARYGSEDAVFALVNAKADLKARNSLNQGAADLARSAGRDSLAARLERLEQSAR
jgi:ankyrin repeat protein